MRIDYATAMANNQLSAIQREKSVFSQEFPNDIMGGSIDERLGTPSPLNSDREIHLIYCDVVSDSESILSAFRK
jgi:hypothetical protein